MDRREQRFKNRTAVTKEQVLNFLCANDAAEQNREAHRCGERNSNGITQPSGAATPRSSDAHKRIAVPRLSVPSGAPPSKTSRVSPCKPLCARLGDGVACVVPAFTCESEREPFVRV